MANETFHDQDEATSAAAPDEIGLWVVASGLLKRISKANYLGGSLTGGGVLATGGFTLTVPATGTAALLGTAQTYTKTRTIAPSAVADQAILINMPASTTQAFGFEVQYNGTQRVYMAATAFRCEVGASNGDLGNDQVGPFLFAGSNTNAGAAGPAAGTVRYRRATGGTMSTWVDNSGLLRIHTSAPTGSTGTPTVNGESAGTVVGTQSSMAAAKHIADDLSPLDEVLQRVADGAAAVRRFAYRSGAFGRQEFEGVVTDYAPAYGMDRDAEHPQGKVLNEIEIMGDLLRAVAWLTERVHDLEEQLHG